MAKRKIQAETVEETLTDAIQTEEAAASETEPVTESNKVAQQDIPDNVLSILKVFSNYPELCITSQGCVYVPGPKLADSKAAILYKNPFYHT